jgi:cytidine deaminase
LITVCAEAIAIGNAILNGERYFDTVVAVRRPYFDEKNRELRVVSPCRMCRELISYLILVCNEWKSMMWEIM